MQAQTVRRSSRKRIVKILSVITGCLLLAIVTLSLIYPYGVFGYRYLFFDSHPHTYSEGHAFRYYKFDVTLTTSAIDHKPTLQDCSNLLEGGIFSPLADDFYAKQPNPNYEPKEDCEAKNVKVTNDAKAYKDLTVNFIIHNDSSSLAVIPQNWLIVTSEKGNVLANSDRQINIGPNLTVKNSFTKTIAANESVSSTSIQFKNLAIQTIVK